MTIRLKLDPRPRKDGKNTVLITLVDGRDWRKKISTDITIEKKFWDDKGQRIKTAYGNSEILNQKIDDLGDKIRTAIDKFSANQFTREQVVSYVSGKTDFDSVDGYIESVIKNSRSTPTYIDYKTAINSLKAHTGIIDRKLLFHDVNFRLLSDFKQKSVEVGMSPASFNSYLTKIRAVMNDAYNKGYIFDKFELDRRLRRPVKKRELLTATPKDILSAIGRIKSIHDWQSVGFWVLMFSMRGMYPADVATLTFANLSRSDDQVTRIKHTRSKTSESANEDLLIRIEDKVLDLILSLKHSVIFTHLPKKAEVVAQWGDLIGIFAYDPNRDYALHQNTWRLYKKKVRTLTGYPYKSARKTFDTIALELSVPDTVRRVLLGHADPSMLSHYDNTQTRRFKEQVEQAHRMVLRDFQTEEIIDALLDKLDALNAPKWISPDHEETESKDMIKFIWELNLSKKITFFKEGRFPMKHMGPMYQ
jgi:hypothetical protein